MIWIMNSMQKRERRNLGMVMNSYIGYRCLFITICNVHRYVKIDTGVRKIRAFLGEKKKSYRLYLDNGAVLELQDLDSETTLKGCQAKAAKKIPDSEVLELLKTPSSISTSFRKLASKNHVISLIKQTKSVSNSFDNSAYYRSCGLCNIPFNTTLPDEKICRSVYCERNRLLIDVWYRKLNKS